MQLSVRRSHSMLKRDYHGQVCSIASSLEVIGERWTLLIVRDVFHGKRRFDEIQEALGVARNVLAARLQRLVEEDILETPPLPGAPRPLRVLPDREGPRPLAGAGRDAALGRPLLRPTRRPAGASSSTRSAAAPSTTAATASAAASVSTPATPTPSAVPAWSERRRPRPGSSCRRCPGSRARRRCPGSRRRWCHPWARASSSR